MAQSKADLAAIGVNARTFAYPYDAYNDTITTAVKNAGYAGARDSDAGFNTKTTNPYRLVTQSVESTVTFDQVKAWIDSARANKTWLILLFHQVDNSGNQYSTTPAMINQIADYLKASHLPVVTNVEGISKLAR